MARKMERPDTRSGLEPLYAQLCGFDFDNAPCADGRIFLMGANREKVVRDVESLRPLYEKARKYDAKLPSSDKLCIPDWVMIQAKQKQIEPRTWTECEPITLDFMTGKAFPTDTYDWANEYAGSGEMHRNTMIRELDEEPENDFIIPTKLGYLQNGKISTVELNLPNDGGYYKILMLARDKDRGWPGGKLQLYKVYRKDPDGTKGDLYRMDAPWEGPRTMTINMTVGRDGIKTSVKHKTGESFIDKLKKAFTR